MYKSQIRIGAVLSYVHMALSIIIGLSYTPIMIRLLGQNEYGLYSTVSSLIAILSVLNLGFGSAYQKYYSKYKKAEAFNKIKNLNGLFLTIFSILGVVALCCGLFLLFHIEFVFGSGLTIAEYDTAKILLGIMIAQLTLFFPTSVFTTIITAHEKFLFSKSLMLLKTALSPLLTLPLLLLGYKSIALVSVSLIVSILCDVLSVYYVVFRLKEQFRFGKIEAGLFKELFAYIAFIALHLIVDQVNWNVDKVLLGRFCGTGIVAIYSVGYSIYSYMIYFGTPISSLFIPKIHRITADSGLTITEKKNAYTKVFTKVGRIQYILVGCIVSGFILFGKPFLQLWVGDGYNSSYWVALLLMIPGAIDLIQVIGIEIQRSQNLHKFRGIVYIVMACINIIISIPLCIHWGAIGSAVGTALSFIVVQGIIINIYLYKKCHVDIFFFWRNIMQISLGILPPFVIGGVCMYFFTINSWTLLLLGIAAYCIIYLISVWLIGLNADEKEIACSLGQKLGIIHIFYKIKSRLQHNDKK